MDDEPWGLDYWKSKDWETVREKLDVLKRSRTDVNPVRHELFDNLRGCGLEKVRVVIVGQDPYPDRRFATGLAFSIPRSFERTEFPSSLKIIFKELSEDLAIGYPTHGDLTGWANQGVLLWNAIPTCTRGVSRSHDWREYHTLTTEVLNRVSEKGAVFCFLGAIARSYAEELKLVDNPNCPSICTGHPSPRGNINSSNPFTGSRLFSTVNAKLVSIGLDPIDWRLDAKNQLIGDKEVEGDVHSRPSHRTLPNITGESCGPLYDKRGICIRK